MRLRARNLHDDGPTLGRGPARPLCRVSLCARHLRRSADGACVRRTRADSRRGSSGSGRTMSRSLDLSLYEGRPDRPFWLVVLVVTAALIGLAVGSARNYGSIVVAQATVSMAPVSTFTFQGTEPNGSLAPDGTLAVL